MNDTKLKITINYDISSDEYAKLVNLLGANFVLVPILNNIDIHTYQDIDSGTKKNFYHLFTWGSSFNQTVILTLGGEWNYGSGVNSGTNSVSYETSGYANYLANTDAVTLSTSIKFCVYKSTTSGGVTTPTGDRLTTIDYSDLVNVSCTFTEVE